MTELRRGDPGWLEHQFEIIKRGNDEHNAAKAAGKMLWVTDEEEKNRMFIPDDCCVGFMCSSGED